MLVYVYAGPVHAAISVRLNGFRSNCKISREFRARAFTSGHVRVLYTGIPV